MHFRPALLSGLLMASLLHASSGRPNDSADSSREQAIRETVPLTLPADFFPIMNWDGLRADWAPYGDRHAGIASLAECNFNTIGFVRPEHLSQCEQLGLKAIVRPAGHPIKWKELSDDQIETVVRASLERSAKIAITARNDVAAMYHLSPADGSEQPLALDHTLWLTAGQGVLIVIR